MKYGNQVISSIRLGSQAVITKIAKGLTIVYEAWKTLIKRGKTPLTITNCQPDTTAIDYTVHGGNDFKTILPDEYQQVEYIQTTGTQYIDSGVPLKNKLKTIVDWIYEETSGSNSYTGGHIGSPGNRWLIGSQRQNNMYFFAVGTGNTTTGVRFGNRDVVEAYWADRASYIKINGVQSTYTFDHLTLSDEPNYTFYISVVNRDGSASSRSKLTIYSWKFYQDDILIRDYVPCYRKSDKVAGLYDLVTNEFYINDGTGEFLIGEPMFPIPTPDTPIEMRGVGDKTKNLLNPNNLEQGGAIDATGVDASSIYRVRTKELVELEAGTYTLSSDTINFRTIHFYNHDTEEYEGSSWASNKNIHTFTLEEKKKVKILFQYAQGNTDPMTVEDVQNGGVLLEKGTEVTEYESYGYKVPITLSGKNLVLPEPQRTTFCTYSLVDNVYHVETIAPPEGLSANVNLYFMIGKAKDLKGKTLIGRLDSGVNMTYRHFVCSSDSEFSASGITSLGAIDTPCIIPSDLDDESYIGIRLYRQPQTVESFTISNLQAEVGEVVTDYEPYITPCTTTMYLNQPINKVGTCVDSLSYKTQSIVKPLGHYQFDGSENWEEHTAAQGCRVYRLDGVLTPKTGAFMSDSYMTHFGLTYTYSTADFIPGFYRFASGNPVDVISSSGRLYVSSTCQTVEEFKEWLSVNKPSIYYPLAEPEMVSVDLPELYLPNETNIITVDTGVSPEAIEITYIGRE